MDVLSAIAEIIKDLLIFVVVTTVILIVQFADDAVIPHPVAPQAELVVPQRLAEACAD